LIRPDAGGVEEAARGKVGRTTPQEQSRQVTNDI